MKLEQLTVEIIGGMNHMSGVVSVTLTPGREIAPPPVLQDFFPRETYSFGGATKGGGMMKGMGQTGLGAASGQRFGVAREIRRCMMFVKIRFQKFGKNKKEKSWTTNIWTE